MQLRLSQLAAHLKKDPAPLYLIHGDEPFLQQEAGDAVRAAARKAGCSERQVLVADAGFKWEEFAAANQNLSLFGERKLIDLRLPSGKPGADGARVLQSYVEKLNAENVTLITSPRLDRVALASSWFLSLEKNAVVLATYPLEREELPQWIAGRLARQNQQASPETLQFLANRTEGNLLAAWQEIEKLGLVLPQGELPHEAVEAAVVDVSRFDAFQLSEAWLAGEAGRTYRILSGLKAEGEAGPLLVWQLGEDLHALAQTLAAMADGMSAATAVRGARVWGKRQAALEVAVRRIAPALVGSLLKKLARLDGLAKGIGVGNFWDELEQAAMALAGASLPAFGGGRASPALN